MKDVKAFALTSDLIVLVGLVILGRGVETPLLTVLKCIPGLTLPQYSGSLIYLGLDFST